MNKYLLTFLGITALVLSSAFTPLSASMQNAIAASSTATNATAAVPTDPTIAYTVQPGDTLSVLAQTYNTSVAAILALNPQITDPNLIYSGQVILIPENSSATAVIPLTGLSVVVTPTTVSAGSQVEVSITNFPAKTPILVSLHPLNSTQYEVNKDATTNGNGDVTVSIKIPSRFSSITNQAWVAQVATTSGTNFSATSNEFVLNASSTEVTTSTFTYVVQSGDTLSTLAQEYGTTKAAIRALNPQITGTYIYPGEILTMPTEQTVVTTPIIPLTGVTTVGPTVIITPSSGPQGTYIAVELTGFRAYTSVDIGLHKLNHKLIESHASATTDAYGQAVVTMRIPTGSNVNNNRVWVAQVSTTTGPELTVSSNPFDVTGQ
jgi:LysM repeat protein